MTTFPLIAIIAVAFTVLWLILFFKQTAKPMPSILDTLPQCEDGTSSGQTQSGRFPARAAKVICVSGPVADEVASASSVQFPEDPFDVEYDHEEEARNSYAMQVEDEILRRIL